MVAFSISHVDTLHSDSHGGDCEDDCLPRRQSPSVIEFTRRDLEKQGNISVSITYPENRSCDILNARQTRTVFKQLAGYIRGSNFQSLQQCGLESS
jgi:hypothetical protein